jgi:hypothetical protein
MEIQNKKLIRELIIHGAILDENSKRPLEEMLMELFGSKRIKDLNRK